MSSIRPTTDEEWAAHLRTSFDPDDQSLAMRMCLVEWLKAKEGRLNQREAHWLELLQGINAVELGFLKQSTAYQIADDRPCLPRWRWPSELEVLFCRSLKKEGQ